MRKRTSIIATVDAVIVVVFFSFLAPTYVQTTPSICSFENIFGAGTPPYYVAYKLEPNEQIKIDGNIDDAAWERVAWTDSNTDICGTSEYCNDNGSCAKGPDTCAIPRFTTRQKLRWDENYLYVAAYLSEPQIWANNTEHDSVIFTDNDYEVFISPDGSNHYYKEYEMNARGVWWDLSLNKPYSDGGYENSSRVFNSSGWDDPGLRTAAKVHGCEINDPSSGPCEGWSVEIKFPLEAISLNNTNSLPPTHGSYWRINFSRVEYKVIVVTSPDSRSYYVKDGLPCENWLWAPLGVVDVHQPERWGYVQFSTDSVNETKVVEDPDWVVRSLAMQIYYAEHAYAAKHNGTYTDVLNELRDYIPLGWDVLSCAETPTFRVENSTFTAYVESSLSPKRIASVTSDRYLLVQNGLI